MKKWIGLSIVLIMTAGMWAWMSNQRNEAVWTKTETEEAAAADKSAHVTLIDQKGRQIGYVHLKQTSKGLDIHLKAAGLPAGKHAFHVHDKGVCETPDFQSAGDHFNPARKRHGFLNREGPHDGDLPNIMVNHEGQADVRFTTSRLSLNPKEEGTLISKSGTAFVVHEKPDDYITEPAGDAGARIACGVIAKPIP